MNPRVGSLDPPELGRGPLAQRHRCAESRKKLTQHPRPATVPSEKHRPPDQIPEYKMRRRPDRSSGTTLENDLAHGPTAIALTAINRSRRNLGLWNFQVEEEFAAGYSIRRFHFLGAEHRPGIDSDDYRTVFRER